MALKENRKGSLLDLKRASLFRRQLCSDNCIDSVCRILR